MISIPLIYLFIFTSMLGAQWSIFHFFALVIFGLLENIVLDELRKE